MHRVVTEALLADEEMALHEAVTTGVLVRVERRGTLLVTELPRTVYGAVGFAGSLVPDLGRRSTATIVAVLRCDHYDTNPPSLGFVTDWDAEHDLPFVQWPKGIGMIHQHYATGKPFLCRPGVREFHAHIQHGDQPWDRYRGNVRPRDILHDLARDLRTKQVFG